MGYHHPISLGVAALCLAVGGRVSAQRVPFAAPTRPMVGPPPTPFADNNGQTPSDWKEPLFRLSHAYPKSAATLLGQALGCAGFRGHHL